ncbi:hypothetical protein J25TS5_08870 [Paenibacillus faecis]|uniref:hypothetical protein n=1 Tax=Paenibacillus TaxID=44249 RepID=UPI001B2086F0|nr:MULTISPECIES: hypothetical protein [Paenibacillus]MCA1295478.1 hypothetical protein [Paenibacillus sp. alder61]GIO83955.1 hypothetical protein J25TS5_08870 [Paenibacillus faecis]
MSWLGLLFGAGMAALGLFAGPYGIALCVVVLFAMVFDMNRRSREIHTDLQKIKSKWHLLSPEEEERFTIEEELEAYERKMNREEGP